MRNLFSINEDGGVEILPQAWLFEKFKAIRDKYQEPGIATIELGLVYFAADYRSNFLSEKDLDTRITKIKNNVYLNRKLKIDDITYQAIDFYSENQDTVKIRLIRAVNSSISSAIDIIEGLDISGLKDIKELAEITAKLPDMLQSLEALEKFVKREEKLAEGIVGAGEKSLYEDG